VLALLAATAVRRALVTDLRRLDRVGQLLEGEPDAPLVRVYADHEQRELVAHAHDLVRAADRPVRHL
jgi:hypothetical protein